MNLYDSPFQSYLFLVIFDGQVYGERLPACFQPGCPFRSRRLCPDRRSQCLHTDQPHLAHQDASPTRQDTLIKNAYHQKGCQTDLQRKGAYVLGEMKDVLYLS